MGVQIQGDNWTRFGIYFLLFLVQVYSKKKKSILEGTLLTRARSTYFYNSTLKLWQMVISIHWKYGYLT